MAVIEFVLSLVLVLVILLLLRYVLLADSDLNLAIAEKFGRKLSDYRGKVIWITGASTGLGKAMAYELASVGAKLVLTARSKDLLEEVKKECVEIARGKLTKEDVLVLPLDVAKCDAHKACLNDVLNHFGQVDVLINNAARYQVGPVLHTSLELEKEIFDVNFFGAIHLTKTVLRHFLERKEGHFVVITSLAGKCGIPSCALYCATKFALHGYYESLRMEHAVNNIHVTIVCPGIFKSFMYRKTIFTEKSHSDDNFYGCDQMTSERCARLTLIAAVNKLYEAWVSYHPFLFMMWMAQYIPTINTRTLMSLVYNKRRVKELNEGIWPKDIPSWEPLFR